MQAQISQFSPICNPLESTESFLNQKKEVKALIRVIQASSPIRELLITKIYESPHIQSYHHWVTEKSKSEKGLSVTQVPVCRERVKEMESWLIKKICQVHLHSQHKIIEVGAGLLNENGHSYLMQRLPETLRDKIEPTDTNQAYVIQSKCEKIKRIDMLELGKIYAPQSVDRIIGSAVLDTLSEEDLTLALKQIHIALKEEGLIVHFSTLEPFKDTLLAAYKNEKVVYFPWVDTEGFFQGLQLISKEALLNFLHTTTSLSTLEANFLNWYAFLPASQRELILNDLILNKNPENIKAGVFFSHWISKMKIEGLSSIANALFFQEKIKKALIATNFKILEFGYKARSHIFKRAPDSLGQEFNYFALECGKFFKKNCYVLAKGYIYQTVKMQVIVAKKFSQA